MEKNTNFTYKNLSPFKWFVLENFPFLEADFDALTEWQLFCKLGKELNKIINSTNTLGTQVENLTNYVTNYFDNLDVQEEVNNKLNEMVEDGTLASLINDELLQNINNEINNINNEINNINNENENKIDIFNPTLEYMFTHHTTDNVFQGLTADNNYYYYANAADNILTKIYKRSLASNELIDTYTNLHFYHCNDLAVLNNKLYSANLKNENGEYSRTIGIYDMTTNTESTLKPFETQEIVNAGYIMLMQIAVYDENHLLCGLGKGYNNLSELGLFLLDIRDNTYVQMPVFNNKNIKEKYYSVFQSFEYQNKRLYMLTSHPTGILEFYEDNGNFYLNNIIQYSSFDNFGLSIGEIEGITKLPYTYNGNNTLLIMSQVTTYTRPNMTLKFYCINTDTNLPYSINPRSSQQTVPRCFNRYIR